jgi:hypothetical protein
MDMPSGCPGKSGDATDMPKLSDLLGRTTLLCPRVLSELKTGPRLGAACTAIEDRG